MRVTGAGVSFLVNSSKRFRRLARLTYVPRVQTGIVCLLGSALALLAAETSRTGPDLNQVLSRIERHYNSLGTLRVKFAQTITQSGRPKIHETGTLSLLRPKKMRWDYEQPRGKLLVGDGDLLHLYNPRTNQVRLFRLDKTGDLRAPLSFLLGRLKFRRQFRNLRIEEIGGQPAVVGEGRRDKDYYSRVEFIYRPGIFSFALLRITGRDGSLTTFAFEDEEINPRLDPALFRFVAPAGAEVLEPPHLAGGSQ